MRIRTLNSLLLVLVIYKDPLSHFVAFAVPSIITKTTLLLLLICMVLLINKLRVNRYFLISLTILSTLLLLNVILVEYKSYVMADIFNVLLTLFVPMYLFLNNRVSIEDIAKTWNTIAKTMTLMLPLHYLYLISGYINYMDLGVLTNLNVIIFTYYLVEDKKNKLLNILLIGINVTVSLVFGSRMLALGTVLLVVLIICLISIRSIKTLVTTIIVTLILVFTWLNINQILEWLISKLSSYGITSRNLNLIYYDLNNIKNEGLYLSGREAIYNPVNEYLSVNGLLPSGLSVARHITNNEYYHSHSFYLEFPLVFGFFLIPFIILYILYKFIILYKLDAKGFMLMLILVISFLLKSVTGTYFVVDSIFIVAVFYLISISRKDTRKSLVID